MEQIINKFEAYLLTEKRVSQSTFEAYMRDIRQLVLYLKGEHNVDIKEAKREHLKDFLFYLKMKQSSAKTMSRKISAIKVFYNYVTKYLEWENIAGELIFPKLDKKLPQYLTEKEIEEIFLCAGQDNSSTGVRNKIMLYLLYVSGMRISEMVNLVVSQIQFDSGFININGKGGKGRIIPIPAEMLKLLDDYTNIILPKLMGKTDKISEAIKGAGKLDKQLNKENSKKNNENNKTIKNIKISKVSRVCKTDFLFPVTYAGKTRSMTRQAFWSILNKLWAKTGSKRSISPHQFRHSLATHMLKNGVDLRSLQMILGHENLCTVQIYTHLDVSYLRDVYNKKHPRA